jgi:RHS repeat-associated protein
LINGMETEASGTNFWHSSVPVATGSVDLVASMGDEAGNLGYATNSITVTIITNAAYGYDNAGNLTTVSYNSGSRTLGLSWNQQYQLTSVSTNGGAAESYTYDAHGRLLTTTVGSDTILHVYDGIHCIADVDDDGDVVRSYVHGPGVDNLLAMTVHGETQTNTYYYLTDHLGSVLAITDDSGAVVETYQYDAYGRTTVYDADGTPMDESALGNRFAFHGREVCWTTGLMLLRARWYDPVIGRWLSKDPIGISGGLNQYVAFGNNPLIYVDPTGLELFPGGESPPGTIFGSSVGDFSELPGAIGEVAGDIWNLPNTAFGLGLGGTGLLLGGTPPYRYGGALVFEKNPAAGFFPIMAIVLGDTVHYAPGYKPDTHVYVGYDGCPTDYFLWDHEKTHIPQERLFGPAFIPTYLFVEPLPGVNPFEAAADKAAEDAFRRRGGRWAR